MHGEVQAGEIVGTDLGQVVDDLRLELTELATGDNADLGDAEQLHEQVDHGRVERRLGRRERIVEVEGH